MEGKMQSNPATDACREGLDATFKEGDCKNRPAAGRVFRFSMGQKIQFWDAPEVDSVTLYDCPNGCPILPENES